MREASADSFDASPTEGTREASTTCFDDSPATSFFDDSAATSRATSRGASPAKSSPASVESIAGSDSAPSAAVGARWTMAVELGP